MRLDAIANIVKHEGPFLTAYLDVRRDSESAGQQLATRWRTAARQLAEQGAPARLVEQLGERVLQPTGAPGENARLVVGHDDEVLFHDTVPCVPRRECVVWSPLPDLGPWLADRGDDVPVLLAVADREGADLELYPRWPAEPAEESTVEGRTEHVGKVHSRVNTRGGARGSTPSGEWMRSDVERHTEEVWRQNARQVADEIESMAHRARLVLLTGDEHACAAIRDALSTGVAAKVRTLEHGSRAPGSSAETLDDEVRRVVAETSSARLERLRADYDERRGRGEGFAEGARGVLEASVQGQVETLLLDPGRAERARVRPDTVPGLSLPSAAGRGDEMPADQVVVAAAARTGADVGVVDWPQLPDDGIAAVLRWEM